MKTSKFVSNLNLLNQSYEVKTPPDTNHFNVNSIKAQNGIFLRKFL